MSVGAKVNKWFECQGCGEVVEIKDLVAGKGDGRGGYHWTVTDEIDIGVGNLRRHERCGPVVLVTHAAGDIGS